MPDGHATCRCALAGTVAVHHCERLDGPCAPHQFGQPQDNSIRWCRTCPDHCL